MRTPDPPRGQRQPRGEDGQVSSTCEGAAPLLQDAGSHWVSVASHFPAAHGRGGRRLSLLHEEQRCPQAPHGPLLQESGSGLSSYGANSPIVLGALLPEWVMAPYGAAGRDASTAGAAAIH